MKIDHLCQAARKDFLYILRQLLVNQFPKVVSQMGLEAAEEWSLKQIKKDALIINYDHSNNWLWLEWNNLQRRIQ